MNGKDCKGNKLFQFHNLFVRKGFSKYMQLIIQIKLCILEVTMLLQIYIVAMPVFFGKLIAMNR